MQVEGTRARLGAGECLHGCFVRYPDPGIAELLALQDFDFLVLDGEHGTMEPREAENMRLHQRAVAGLAVRLELGDLGRISDCVPELPLGKRRIA